MPFDETTYQRVSCTSDTPSIRMSQGQQITHSIIVRDIDGNAVDLDDYVTGTYLNSSSSSWSIEPNNRLDVKMAVSQAMNSSTTEYTLTGTITDRDTGAVDFLFTPTETSKHGIFTASVGVFYDDILRHQIMFYIEIAPTNFSTNSTGPISIAEVRMDLMDVCPDANYLLDDLEFTDADIVHAMRKAVDVYNDALPPIGGYTYDSFPFRSLHLKGTVTYLLKAIAHKYRRNALHYSAGGIAIKDQEKHSEYYNIAKHEEKEYLEMVERRKVAANLSAGYGSVGRSPYGRL